MQRIIKRGHTDTKLPKEAINAVFGISMRSENKKITTGYGYVMYVPSLGLIENGGSRSSNYKRTWYDCLKDIIECVPKKSTVMVHCRFKNFVTAMVGDRPLPTDTEQEKKWREKITELCEKKNIKLYMHRLFGERDQTEKKAGRIANVYMRKEYIKG